MARRAVGRHVEDPLLGQIGLDLGLGHHDLIAPAGHGQHDITRSDDAGAAGRAQIGLTRNSSGTIGHSAASASGLAMARSADADDVGDATASRRRRCRAPMDRRPWRRARRCATTRSRGNRRPTPATSHTGTPHVAATAATAAEPIGATTRSIDAACASTITTSAAGTARPIASACTSSHTTSYRSSRCIIDEPWCRLSTHEHRHVAAAGQGA